MRPFENPVLRLLPALQPTGVLLPARPRVAERSAGLAQVGIGATNPTALPTRSDFSITGTARDAAYFLLDSEGFPGERVRGLVTGSAAQILRDIREELGVTTGERIYSVGLLERAAVRAAEFNRAFPAELRAVIPNIPRIPDTGVAPVSMAWMGILLWCTYFADMPRGVLIWPQSWKMPDMVTDVFPETTGLVTNYSPFIAGDLRVNPFVTRLPGELNVQSDPTSTGSDSSSSNSGGVLLAGGLLLLLLLGDSK